MANEFKSGFVTFIGNEKSARRADDLSGADFSAVGRIAAMGKF